MKTLAIPSVLRALTIFFALIIFTLNTLPLDAQTKFVYEDLIFDETPKNNLPPGWEYQTNSQNPHGMIVTLPANPRVNDRLLQAGDFIGAFYHDDNGNLKCGGADFWLGTENIIFAVFGNDQATPEKDGFAYNEIMYFKVFLQETQKSYDVDLLAFDPEYSSTDHWFPLSLSSIIDFASSVTFDAYATANPNPICIGNTVNLEAHIFVGTTGNYSYNWSSQPPGFSNSLPECTDVPAETTTYFLGVSDGTNFSTDSILVEVLGYPQLTAGDDFTICVNQQALLSATAASYSALQWITSGDGTFANPSSLQTTYFPGAEDISNDSVSLTITAFPLSPCQSNASEDLILFFQKLPSVSLPETLSFCENEAIVIQAEAQNYNLLSWNTSGDGTFLENAGLTNQYFPGTNDLSSNHFTISVSASAQAPCQAPATDALVVNLTDMPLITAPASRTACENMPVNVTSVVSGHSSVLWTSQGDGTFANPAATSTQYFPGAADHLALGTSVTITAYGQGLCISASVSKTIQIILLPLPVVDAGNNGAVCSGKVLQLSANANNQAYVLWNTLGDGYFSNAYSLTSKYYPGVGDIAAGNFSLALTAYANYPCVVDAKDTLAVDVIMPPSVEIAWNTKTICYGDVIVFDQSQANDYSSLEWFAVNGTGTFDDNTLLHPTYTPDPGHDYQTGGVTIGVFAQAIAPCVVADEDFMTLQFQAPPEVTAANDAVVFEGDSFAASASGINYTSVNWQSSGDGTFNNPGSLLTDYFPGTNDISNEEVDLLIYALPRAGCILANVDTIKLTIQRGQQIVLATDKHSLSTYIDVQGGGFVDVMEPVLDKVIFAQHFTQIYWPEFNINTLTDSLNSKGYEIQFSGDTTLRIHGYAVDNSSVLLKAGWNNVPVLSRCPVASQDIIDQLGIALIIISEINGDKVAWPAGGQFSLNELLPGDAYMIKVASDTQLVFPACN